MGDKIIAGLLCYVILVGTHAWTVQRAKGNIGTGLICVGFALAAGAALVWRA